MSHGKKNNPFHHSGKMSTTTPKNTNPYLESKTTQTGYVNKKIPESYSSVTKHTKDTGSAFNG